jgi:3-oxoadipate enol-lactonase
LKLTLGRRTVRFEIAGPPRAPVVLFVHSLGTDLRIWDAQARALSARLRCLRYDLPGHGQSDDRPPGFGLDELSADALALLDEVGAPRAHVCGLSLGGMVAQRLAARAPDRVERLALCATALRVGTAQSWAERVEAVRHAGLEALAEGILGRWFTPELRVRQPETWAAHRDMLCRTSVEGYVGGCLALADADLQAQAAAIRAPTRVIVGDQDVATPPLAAQAVCRAIAGANLSVLRGAAHMLTAERSQELTTLLVEHLDVRNDQGGDA